mmetsp:Transcript_30773/g.70900  ORF Transcript_30773/g.70900 Transcript_30773/m.70900 type:complete len:91 (-) Transcript_30773:139-411(-)
MWTRKRVRFEKLSMPLSLRCRARSEKYYYDCVRNASSTGKEACEMLALASSLGRFVFSLVIWREESYHTNLKDRKSQDCVMPCTVMALGQ